MEPNATASPDSKAQRSSAEPDDPLRVLVVTNLWPRDDAPHYGTFVESQTRSLAQAGVAITVHVVDGRRSRLAYLRSALRMISLNFGPKAYDLVHAHTGHCGLIARLQWRYPLLISYVGYDLYGNPTASGAPTLKSRVEATVFRRLAAFATSTVTKSQAMADLLPHSARRRNTVLPNGVDHSHFRPLDRAEARDQLGWPQAEPAVVWVGNDLPRKRLGLARAAVARATDEISGLRLRVCSQVDPSLVPVWMNAADAMVFTSLAEGSPNVIKEAMACDLPIVTVAVGDTAEVVTGARNCEVVTDDADDLAAALVRVLQSGDRRSDGRARTADLALPVIAARLVGIYDEVTGRATP